MDFRRRFSAYTAKASDPRAVILAALHFAQAALAEPKLEERTRFKIAVVVEELVSNCLRHGGKGRDIDLVLSLEAIGGAGLILLEDSGEPFDPTKPLAPVSPSPRDGGGIGLAIVQAWGSDMAYERRNGRNWLKLVIR